VEVAGGSCWLWGSEKPEDNHGAVTRLPDKLSDFVIEYDFKFEGAKATTLSLNAAKGHLARIAITPKSVAIQKDDMDHAGPDKAVVFARFSADFQPGVWHTVRMEMVGDTLLGKVDGYIAWGASDVFKQERIAPGLTVGGQSVEFRNLRIFEASLNPRWSEVQAALPKPRKNGCSDQPARGPASSWRRRRVFRDDARGSTSRSPDLRHISHFPERLCRGDSSWLTMDAHFLKHPIHLLAGRLGGGARGAGG
jgi:hypothetical protein